MTLKRSTEQNTKLKPQSLKAEFEETDRNMKLFFISFFNLPLRSYPLIFHYLLRVRFDSSEIIEAEK